MRGFTRSAAGKVLLVIVFSICFGLGIVSMISGTVLVERNAYSVTAEQYMQSQRSRIISNEAQETVTSYVFNMEMSQEAAEEILCITRPDGSVLYQSSSWKGSVGKQADTEVASFYLVGVRSEEGYLLYEDWINPDSVPDAKQFAKEVAGEEGQIYDVKVDAESCLRWAGVDYLYFRILIWIYGLRYAIWPICAAAWILCIILFTQLMRAAGRSSSDELVPGPFFMVPYDLMALGYLTVFAFGIGILQEFPRSSMPQMTAVCAFFFGMTMMALGMCMSFASRLKQHMLWKRLLTVRLARLLWRGLKKSGRAAGHAAFQLPLVWRSALAIAVISVLEFFAIIAFHWDGEWLLLLWMLEKIVLVPFVLCIVLSMRRLQKAGQAMAAGNLQYQIETKGMLPDFKEHAENLSSISDAMTMAVEQRLKSERMKTELITNVSHDIKTPLTSIINYTDLILREKPENEKISEYCEVLMRQAGKLKRLIEDLVEASKASTGNLEVNPVPCDASVFLQQAGGEYEEKLQAAGLTLVTKIPEQDIMILADSRRMWRVFDNLMNNVCKYSQRGTRVYLSLEEENQEAVITFKNTSAQQLDITPEELMERFVRGDASRNTEGNGLGLAIARSLTELQGGELALQVDGDLFKAILRFPVFFITS